VPDPKTPAEPGGAQEILTQADRADLIEALLWQRSVYWFINAKRPEWLVSFGTKFSTTAGALAISTTQLVRHAAVAIAANLIRRCADIALYEDALRRELAGQNPWRGAAISGSLFVGYFSAAKSLLDAVTIALATSHSLNLPPKEQDFAKNKFWVTLRQAAPGAVAELEPLRPFTAEVVRWRDAAVHRTTPLIVVDANMRQLGFKAPDQIRRDEVNIVMASDPDSDFAIFGSTHVSWMDPMEKPNQWRPLLDKIGSIGAGAILHFIQQS
jgi:hypothetical protein